jgi:hypothetical protein
MAGNRRSFFILFALTLVFAAAFFAVKFFTVRRENGFSLVRDETIAVLTIRNNYGVFQFTRQKEAEIWDSWTVVSEGVQYRANADKMKLLIASLSDLPVQRVLESEKDIYGLSKPAALVSVKTSAGRGYEYTFGGSGVDVNTVYVKNNAGSVILTDASALLQITGNLAAYRDKKIFFVDLLNLAGLEYARSGLPVVNCRREGPTRWYLDYPYKAPARHIELTEFVAAMTGWMVAGYPETAVDYGALGLDPPLETLILTDMEGKKQTLTFGRAEGLGRYVQLGNRHDVVLLYAADTDLSVLSPETLLFIAPLRAQMDEVSGFSVERGDARWGFAYDSATGFASWDYGALSGDEFVGVFYKFISMVADGRDTRRTSAGVGEAASVLHLNLRNGGTVRLELLPRNEDTYFMRIDGADTPYYINAKRLLSLLDRISELTAKSQTHQRPYMERT